jgi:FkbM family methyltransferase
MRPGDIYRLIERLQHGERETAIADALKGLLHHAGDLEIEKYGAFILEAKTIFDVGANVGNSTRWFRQNFPEAKIYAFEPITPTFNALAGNVGQHPLTICERLAFGAESGTVTMTAKPLGTMNKILTEPPSKRRAHEDVQRVTGARYCAQHGIDSIDILKIDTEGHDLNVLVGFRSMIVQGKVKYIQVEAGMNPENPVHVGIRRFMRWLEPKGYRVSSIHSQAREKNSDVLRRSDVVFVYAPPPAAVEVDPPK